MSTITNECSRCGGYGLVHGMDGGPPRWHLSISCPDRHPSWDEIKTARYRLLGPDLNAAMFLPPAAEYVNVPAQDHVFHVWEVGLGQSPPSG